METEPAILLGLGVAETHLGHYPHAAQLLQEAKDKLLLLHVPPPPPPPSPPHYTHARTHARNHGNKPRTVVH